MSASFVALGKGRSGGMSSERRFWLSEPWVTSVRAFVRLSTVTDELT